MASRFPARDLLILLLASSCLFLIAVGSLPLIEPDEGRNAEVAREMLASGEGVTAHFDRLTYLDKPAVFFWLVATSFRAFGVSEWAARLPSALAALATVLVTWALARRLFDGRTGLRAGVILATSPLPLVLGRLVVFDMTLTFFVTIALACFAWAGWKPERPAWLDALMFGAMGLATLTKGPVGFLLPLLSILAYQALRGGFGELKAVRWGLGLAVFLAVVLPWFIAVSAGHPDFPRYALWQESLRRFVTGHVRRTGNVGYYVPVYLAGFFPWSLFLLPAVWNRWKRRRELRQASGRPAAFLLAWAGVVFVFFSISQSKLPAYFLPAVVPLSILMARAWTRIEASELGRPPDWVTAGFAALLALGLLVALASHAPLVGGAQARMFNKLHPSVLAALKPCVLYSGLILAALGVVGRNVARRARGFAACDTAFAFVALTVPLLALRWIGPVRAYAASISSRSLAEAILRSPERDLPLYGYYYFRTSLPFYLRRPVGLITSDGSETTSNYVSAQVVEAGRGRGRFLASAVQANAALAPPQSAPVLVDLVEFNLLFSRRPVLVLARNSQVWELPISIGQVKPLWTGWEYSVWKVTDREAGTQK